MPTIEIYTENKIIEKHEPFSFFNTDEFVCSRHSDEQIIRFFLGDFGNRIAKFVLTIRHNDGYSPWMAPYGSLENIEGLDSKVLLTFIRHILQWCKDQNIRSIHLINFPEFYFTYSTEQIFNKSGFQLKYGDVCQYIEVTPDFYNQLTYAERARLNKCKRNDFVFRHETSGSLEEAYALLNDSMIRKGYPVNMTFGGLKEMFIQHPDQYYLFAVFDDKSMVSMAVSIRINEHILYNFYHADHADYASFSPTVMLVEGVNQFALENGYKYIDLGVSSEKGTINQGLYKFKRNLGALESFKNTYYIEI